MAAVQLTNAVWPTNKVCRLGPFQDSNGNLWVVGYLSGSGNEITVWKSSDSGATWGTYYTSSGANRSSVAYDAVFDSDVIYVVALTPTTYVAQIWKFDIGTTTWSRVDSGTGPTPLSDVGAVIRVFLGRRSTGDFVVFYNGPLHSNMGTSYRSAYYSTCSSSGTWGTGVEIDAGGGTSYDVKSAVMGASSWFHMFYTYSTNNLYHRQLDTSNNLYGPDQVAGGTNNQYFGIAYYYVSANKIMWSDANSPFYAYRATSQASWTSTPDSNTVGTNNVTTVAPVFLYDGTTLHCFYRDSTTSDVFHNTASGTTWGTAASLEDTSGVNGISAEAITGGVGFVYNEGAGSIGVYFDKLVQAGPKAIAAGAISGTSSFSGAVTAKKTLRNGVITATSSISGLVGRIRRITSGAITGTSSISGLVQRLRRIPGGVITGTSSISGALTKIAIRAIAGGQITGVSSISGGPRALRRITGVITGVSTISGAIRVIRRIAPAGITGTSSISGLVGAIRKITPSAIPGVSSVSGSVRVLRGIIPAGIVGTSSFNASGYSVLTRIIPSGITATSVFSGLITAIRRVAPVGITGTSSVSGTVSKIGGATKPITSGVITGTSAFTGGVVSLRRIVGAVTAISSVSGALRAYRAVTGAITAQSSVSGTVTKGVPKPLTVSGITAVSSISGGIRVLRRITGVITGTSAVSGSLRVIRRITGVVTGTSSITGTVTKGVPKPLTVAGITATSVVSGGLRAFRAIVGVITGTSAVSGTVVVTRRITGGITGTSSITAALAKLGTALIHGGQIQGVSTFTGIVGVRRVLAVGNILGISSMSGGIRAFRRITGAISAVSSITATVRALRRIAPSAIIGTSAIAGNIGRVVHLVGTINSTSTISGHVAVIYKITGGEIAAESSFSGTVLKQGKIRGDIWATSTISGSIRVGYTVWGREIPQLTSAGYAKPEIISANGNSAPRLIEVT